MEEKIFIDAQFICKRINLDSCFNIHKEKKNASPVKKIGNKIGKDSFERGIHFFAGGKGK